MRTVKWLPAVLVFIIGFSILLNYAFTTEYLEYCDAAREYQLYLNYAGIESVDTSLPIYTLQNSCLTTTLLPALIQRVFNFPAKEFYSIYLCVLLALISVSVYHLSRRFNLSIFMSMIAAFYSMFWVTFYQGPSMARSGVAILFFSLISLMILNRPGKSQYILIGLLSVLITVTHYTTALITLGVYLLCLAYFVYKYIRTRKRPSGMITSLIICLTLIISGVIWLGYFHPQVGGTLYCMMRYSFSGESISELSAYTELLPAISTNTTSAYSKMSQAVLGGKLEGDGVYQFMPALLITGWMTASSMMVGIFVAIKRKILNTEYAVSIIALIIIAGLSVVVPFISRIYGVERVFHQLLSIASPFYVTGVQYILGKIKTPAIITVCLLIILTGVYGYLMMNYGIIHSLIGY